MISIVRSFLRVHALVSYWRRGRRTGPEQSVTESRHVPLETYPLW